MKLYAVSYFNIWPFVNSKISIFIQDGKYLIQSPIGRWKSFLFFDGIVYALYGYAKRDMLNVESTEWYTKILFENDDWDTFSFKDLLLEKNEPAFFSIFEKTQKLAFRYLMNSLCLIMIFLIILIWAYIRRLNFIVVPNFSNILIFYFLLDLCFYKDILLCKVKRIYLNFRLKQE